MFARLQVFVFVILVSVMAATTTAVADGANQYHYNHSDGCYQITGSGWQFFVGGIHNDPISGWGVEIVVTNTCTNTVVSDIHAGRSKFYCMRGYDETMKEMVYDRICSSSPKVVDKSRDLAVLVIIRLHVSREGGVPISEVLDWNLPVWILYGGAS